MKYGISLPTFDEPKRLVEMARRIESTGWDGCFLWDHILGSRSDPMPIVDPWVVLGAIAAGTERIRLGTVVTPLPRRRPQVVAREIVTLDRLSSGRAVLGVGIGNPLNAEYEAFGEPADPVVLGQMLDESLEVIAGLSTGRNFIHHGAHYRFDGGAFQPVAVQQPRVPIWVSCTLPAHRRPLDRAARWDGIVLTKFGPEGGILEVTPDEVRAMTGALNERRPAQADYDVAVLSGGGTHDAEAMADAGATWWLRTGWPGELSAAIEAGPTRH